VVSESGAPGRVHELNCPSGATPDMYDEECTCRRWGRNFGATKQLRLGRPRLPGQSPKSAIAGLQH